MNIANLIQTFEKSSFQKLLNRILRYCTLIVLWYGHYCLFVQMVVPARLLEA